MTSGGRAFLSLRGRNAATIFLLVICLFLSACSAPQTRQLLSQRQPSERQGHLLDVPFYPQTQYQCGPAALAGLLQYYGVDTSPEELEPLVYLPERKGSLQLEMKAAVRRHELIAYPLVDVERQAMVRLLNALDENYPVLVLQNLGIDSLPQWHYAVVTGYDLRSREIILNSGIEQNYRMGISRFERTWKRGGFWGLLATPPEKIPDLADPLDWNRAVFESEQTDHALAAFSAYQAALERWPDNQLALLGSGNTAYSLNRFSLAAENFYQLSVINGEQAATGWNNLAYALMSLQCLSEARHAAALALSIEPDSQAILRTVEELGPKLRTIDTGDPQAEHCQSWRLRLQSWQAPSLSSSF